MIQVNWSNLSLCHVSKSWSCYEVTWAALMFKLPLVSPDVSQLFSETWKRRITCMSVSAALPLCSAATESPAYIFTGVWKAFCCLVCSNTRTLTCRSTNWLPFSHTATQKSSWGRFSCFCLCFHVELLQSELIWIHDSGVCLGRSCHVLDFSWKGGFRNWGISLSSAGLPLPWQSRSRWTWWKGSWGGPGRTSAAPRTTRSASCTCGASSPSCATLLATWPRRSRRRSSTWCFLFLTG